MLSGIDVVTVNNVCEAKDEDPALVVTAPSVRLRPLGSVVQTI